MAAPPNLYICRINSFDVEFCDDAIDNEINNKELEPVDQNSEPREPKGALVSTLQLKPVWCLLASKNPLGPTQPSSQKKIGLFWQIFI